MHQIFAHTAEDWFGGFKGGSICTDHKGQCTVFGAQSPPGYRCITDANLFGLRYCGNLLNGLRVNGAAIDTQAARLKHLQNTVFA
ncbi:hypothetical protein SDC9_183953 [bioreactor metagenome]|uniref:Uncharacterized protein n=1 Tax=bioreactor metagenome TaxID=1076179 RepID=A0A645HJX2_9ZZZZ